MEGSRDRAREAIDAVREHALPAAGRAPGFEGLLFFLDRKAGRAVAVTLWESLEDLEASEELAQHLRSLPVARWSVGGAERFEVVICELPARS